MTPRLLSALTVLVALVASAGDLCAQLHVQVTHGQGKSGITGYDHGEKGAKYEVPHRRIPVPRLSVGDSVCFNVTTAHAVFYNYTIGLTVDTTSERLPDVSSAVALLNAAMGGTPAVRNVLDDPGYIGEFFRMFEQFMKSLEHAQQEIDRSDSAGIAVAKTAVAKIPSTPTADDLKRWRAGAGDNTPAGRMTIAALEAYGKTLLSTRDALKKSYPASVPEVVSKCAAISRGSTTVKLDIKKKTDFGERDVGEGIATVVVRSRYDRSWVEAAPILLTGFVRDLSEFSIQDSVVTRTVRPSKVLYRPGGILTVNLRLDEVTFGPFVGLGVTSENKLSLSDYLGGILVSYRDLVRIGIGGGSSQVVTRLRAPAKEGEKLTGDVKLEDLLEKDGKQTLYLVIALPGLSLKNPWP